MAQMSKKENEQEQKPIELLTTAEAAKEWKISKKALYKLVEEGRLKPIVNLGKQWRFLKSDWNEAVFIRL